MTRLTLFCVLILALIPAVGVGQKPAADEKPKEAPKKVEWAGLRTLLEAGEYAKAIMAADEILTVVKPDRKAPDFLPRCVDSIDVLMRRGFAELQLGQLDPADATFLETHEIFKDREFFKQVTAMEKQGGPKMVDPLIDLDLRLIELQNLRVAVVLERLRRVHADQAAVNGEAKPPAQTLVEDIGGWIEAIRGLVKSTADTRKKLADRFEKGGPSVVGSPHKRALMSSFHPELIAGIVAFEASRLPFDMPPAATSTAGAPKAVASSTLFDLHGLDASQRLEKSLVHFGAASQSLAEALEAALPKGVASAPTDKRLEADVLLSQLSIARCAALLRKRDMAGARNDVDKVLELHKEMAGLRKVANPDAHPERLLPLIFATEVALGESEELFRAGMVDEARAVASKASETLAKAAALPLVDDHPRRHDLSRLASAVEKQRAEFEASVVITDAAEVAARRIRRAVERTAAGF